MTNPETVFCEVNLGSVKLPDHEVTRIAILAGLDGAAGSRQVKAAVRALIVEAGIGQLSREYSRLDRQGTVDEELRRDMSNRFCAILPRVRRAWRSYKARTKAENQMSMLDALIRDGG